jgi:hypothetical protein
MQMNGFFEDPADSPLVSAVGWTPESVDIVVEPVAMVAGGIFSECGSIAL